MRKRWSFALQNQTWRRREIVQDLKFTLITDDYTGEREHWTRLPLDPLMLREEINRDLMNELLCNPSSIWFTSQSWTEID